MQSNLDIYLIGLSVLVFLTIIFLFIRKVSSGNDLKVKIEEVSDSFEIKEYDDVKLETQKSFDFEEQEFINDQELVVLNLISMDFYQTLTAKVEKLLNNFMRVNTLLFFLFLLIVF